ncbi:hypothetical protein D4764_06G0009470 [Takifugu flavidus]|uniref:Uncharacterized protein n=1 Tax=Takifugu flavidus TaxID=433684 RepID=A0A5C6N192_9TELE|nr:hypothetical protein D4764_06G0009470 [Takifugu flavidus]
MAGWVKREERREDRGEEKEEEGKEERKEEERRGEERRGEERRGEERRGRGEAQSTETHKKICTITSTGPAVIMQLRWQ